MIRVREPNDAFRTTLRGGREFMTANVAALANDVQMTALAIGC